MGARERLARCGEQALSEAELIALILGAGFRGRSAYETAASLLKDRPSPEHWEFESLSGRRGVGPARAAALLAAREFGRRAHAELCRPVLDAPGRVADQVPLEIKASRKEHFLGFYLDARSRLLHRETISVGTLSASLVHPREVFAPALAHAAAALIVVHNHPSGDCTPSPEDAEATRRLTRAGELLGIPLLDHVVVSERGFWSFREAGRL